MAIVANTATTYVAKGIREQLSNVIYNISPEETPFISNAGGGPKLENTFFEWQTDSLAAAATNNQQLEADDIAAFDAIQYTVRMGAHAQISRKTVIVGGTEEEVNKAGRKSELAYQVSKKGAELKRDMEAGLLLPANVDVAGAAATARVTAGIGAYIKTNVDFGAGGVNPVYTTLANNARTDGTTRAFTEAQLKNVIQLQWAQGGKSDTVMVGGTQKQAASAFAGIATKTYQMTQAKTASIIGAADVYVSDFGTFVIVPNRFQRSRDAWVLDFDLIEVRYLREFRVIPLAKTGDAEKRMLLAEFGLQVNQEAGLGLVADLV